MDLEIWIRMNALTFRIKGNQSMLNLIIKAIEDLDLPLKLNYQLS
jgi:hypothetical protein